MKKPVFQKALSLFLAVLLVLSLCVPIFAEEVATTDTFDKFLEAYTIYKDKHLYGKDGEQVLLDTLKKLLETDPKLFRKVMMSLVKSEDKFGNYFTAEEYVAYLNQKQYSGIGVSVSFINEVVTVTDVTPGTPADKAGVKEGDIIYKVNQKKAYGLDLETLRNMIRGDENTIVKISFYRPSELKVYAVTMVREPLISSTVKYTFHEEADGKKYAVVKISDFLGISTYFEFINFKNAAVQKGVDKVVFDLRDNPGGDLNVVLELINWCIPEADKLICSIYAKNKELLQEFKTTGKDDVFSNVAILVNKDSASAAELFAIALQENGIAKVFGTKTYGKAIGQTHLYLADKSVVSITTLEVASPNGVFYNGRGVIPDVEITNNEYTPGVVPFKALNHKNFSLAKMGAKNEAIFSLEQRLVHLGLLDVADNSYDQKTSEGVQQLQLANNLPVTGALDKTTFELLTDVMNLVKYTKPGDDKQMAAAVDYILQ